MKWSQLTTAMLAASITLTACINSPPQQTTKPEIIANSKMVNIAYEKFTLNNGLEVIFHLDRSGPVVAIALTAHVGSAREKVERTGFAHLFKHWLFLESENLRFFINTITEQVLAKEKQVVKNEKCQNVDNRPNGYTQHVIDKNGMFQTMSP